MGLLDLLKTTAMRALSESGISQQFVDLAVDAVRKVEGTTLEVLGDPEAFRRKIAEPSYHRLPGTLQQMLSIEQWDAFLFSIKDQVFTVENQKVRLQPEFRAGINAFFRQLILGKKQATTNHEALPKGDEETQK